MDNIIDNIIDNLPIGMNNRDLDYINFLPYIMMYSMSTTHI